MAKKKEEQKIGVDPNVFMEIMDKKIAEAMCTNEEMRPMVECLEEFGITGVKLVAFIMRLTDLTSKHNAEKADIDELIGEA